MRMNGNHRSINRHGSTKIRYFFATNFYKKVKNIKALINNFLFFNLLKEKLIVNH